MGKRSYRVALGGMIAALCTVILFLTGPVPLGVYTLPAVAGILLVAIVIEAGFRWGLLTYAVVAILSLFITPDMEAKLLFIFFFGYYPIIKAKLECMRSRMLEWITKIGLFNVAIVSSYLMIIYVVGMKDVLNELGAYGHLGAIALLALGNVVFVLYDIATTRLISLYMHYRPNIFRRLK